MRRNRKRFGRLGYWGIDEFRGDVSKVWMNDWGEGSRLFRKWRDGMGVVVIVGNGVVGGVNEMFWVIGVGTDSGTGIFKVNDALEF